MKLRYTHPYPRMNISLDDSDIRDLLYGGWFHRELDNYPEGVTISLNRAGESYLWGQFAKQFDLGTKSNEQYMEAKAILLDRVHHIANTASQYEHVAKDPNASELDIVEFKAKASGLREALHILTTIEEDEDGT